MALSDNVNADHYEEIVITSAVNPDVAEARGYRTLTGTDAERTELEDMGYRRTVYGRDDAYPTLLIPMHGADGEINGYQIKPAVPRTRTKSDGTQAPVKYESPTGSPLVVDIPAFTRSRFEDLGTPLWITEGMKKTDALVSAGIAALGLTGVFNWRNKMGTLGDWESIPLANRPVVICFDSDAAGNRNVQLAMTRLGAWLKTRRVSTVHYLIVPQEVSGTPVKGVDDYLAAGGTVADLGPLASQTPPGGGAADAAFTDAYLVEEVCSGALENRFCWSSGLGWMKWNGKVWKGVSDTEPVEAIRVWALTQFEGVLADQKRDPARNLQSQITGWRGVLAKARLRALLDLARGIVERYSDEFDSDADLLSAANGTVDLRTGALMPHDPAHSITLLADAEYVPGARHVMWDKALQALPEGSQEWYQDRLGQAATGYKTPDHVMVLSHGSGSNGKSTIVNTLRKTLGGYGVVISDRVLMASPDAHPTELMELRGARYAVLEETPEARQLNVQRLKTVLGTETITARHIRQDSVEFPVTHSLFINTNFRPHVSETDHCSWRRLSLLSFPFTNRSRTKDLVSPTDRMGDPRLEYAHHDPGVRTAALSWIVEGAVRWYARDRVMLPLPEGVEDDTRLWRSETDLVMGFADDSLVFGPDHVTPTQALLGAFNSWVTDRGHRPWNEKTFGSRFGSHDVMSAHRVTQGRSYVAGRRTRVWKGVGISHEPDNGAQTAASPFEPGPTDDGQNGQGQQRDGWDSNSDNQKISSPYVRVNQTAVPSVPLPVHAGHDPADDLADPAVPTGGAGFVPFDLETLSADELFSSAPGSFVRLVGVGDSVSTSVNGTDLAGQSLVGHNSFFFDSLALDRHHGIPVEQTITGGRDLRIAAFQNDPPTSYQTKAGPGFKSYSLDALGERYLGISKSGDGKALAKEFGGWSGIPAEDPRYVQYCRDDVELTRKLDAAIPYDPYEKREASVCAITARSTLSGFRVDVEGLQERSQSLADRSTSGRELLSGAYGFPLTDAKGLPAKAPQRSSAGKAAFEAALSATGFPVGQWPRGKDGSLSLSKETMAFALAHAEKQFPGAADVIRAVSEMNGIRNNAANVLRCLVGDRVHPAFLPFQATGRWSVLDPGLSVLKKGTEDSERAFLLSDEGDVLVSIDLDQIDIRCVAAHSQDHSLLEILNDPTRDFHSEVSDMAFGNHEGKNRHNAKSLDLGWLYGRTVNGLSQTPGMTRDIAVKVDASMRERFTGVLDWQRSVRETAESGVLLDNGFGRRLRVDPDRAFTQAPGFVGQSTTRDLIAEGLLDLAKRAPEVIPMLRVIVHDEVVASVPREHATEVATLIRDCMTRWWAPAGLSRPVHITAGQGKEFVFGDRWSDLY